jgi:xanthine dehydrogenase YagR molybdenum-binding subunit
MSEITLTRDPAHIRHGSSIGQPLTRRDGVLKVTGEARYAADNHPPKMLFAVLATSTIARGRVASLDVAAAKRHPGVVDVMTPQNRPALAEDPDAKTNPFMFRMELLQNDSIRYANQAIAVVIAETLEAATEGAALLSPRYEAEPARSTLDDAESYVPPAVGIGHPAVVAHGDAADAIARAAHAIEATYETPAQYHNPMEPHAIVASWNGDALSIDTPTQGLAMAQGRIAGLFGISPEKIHIRSPFLGGGFGCKGLISGPQILGILAAKLVGRPVKLVLRRDQMYGPVGHRSTSRQRLRMAATADGQLTAIDHHAKISTSTFDDFYEPAADASHSLYASPVIATSHEAVRLDIGTPLFMRAPGEATGSIALESAIDEIAEACGIDPLAFRLKNYAEVEPITGKPFSSKALRECYVKGAEKFGWSKRPLKPRQVRDENGFLVGWGMGTATFPALMFAGQARAVIRRDGSGVVETGAHDMGQGAWTALAQIAGDSLALDLDHIEFKAGTSDLPDAGIAGGSAHTATAGKDRAMRAHGAVFAEVKVDPDLGQIRVSRMVGAFAAGRIVNPHLVKSQYLGGMIWGVSFALHEKAIVDHRSGRIMNANLAEYHVPVNADIPAMEALMVEEHDPHVNPLGIKGVGEIAITGSAGAVANAVWHATGIRVRRFPVAIEDLVK